MILLLALIGGAHAQETLDAHGFRLVPNDGDLLDYIGTWRSEAQEPNSFSATGLFEYADSTLVLMRQAGDDPATREVLVDNLFGLNVGATYAPAERVLLAVSAPVYFTSVGPEGAAGVGIGDLRLAAPISVIVRDPEAGGIGVSGVPYLDLPTGAQARFLGSSGVGGGFVLAAGYAQSRLSTDVNLGVGTRPGIEYENLRGGPYLMASAAGAYAVTDWLGVRVEALFQPSVAANRVPGTESPAETLLSARGRYDSGLSWTFGGAAPLSYGAGAAAFRVFGGVGYTAGKRPDPDTDLDGYVDPLDGCPLQAEVFNGWNDEDGCPDALADLLVTVVNEDGQLVPGARVVIDGQEHTTDEASQVRVEARLPGTALSGSAHHPHYKDAVLAEMALAEGPNEQTITLLWLPGKVRVVTKSNTGAIIDARVRFEGPVPKDPQSVGDDGMEVFELRPGDWRLLVSAEAFGTERRDLRINPGETSLVVIEVILYPTKTEVRGTEIRILEQVQFDFDKATIKADSFTLLEQVANVLLDHPEILVVEVAGHTDDRGNDAYNLELSQRRVESVRTFLIERGIAPERLVAKGYGETVPVASNKSEKGRAENRRVQFMILEPAPTEPPAPEGTP